MRERRGEPSRIEALRSYEHELEQRVQQFGSQEDRAELARLRAGLRKLTVERGGPGGVETRSTEAKSTSYAEARELVSNMAAAGTDFGRMFPPGSLWHSLRGELAERSRLRQQRASALSAAARDLLDLQLRELDDKIRRRIPAGFDPDFRLAQIRGGAGPDREYTELPWPEARFVGDLARAVSARSFVETFLGAAAEMVPLLDLAEVLRTTTGAPLDASVITAQPDGGLVPAGGPITPSGPDIDDEGLDAWSYKMAVQMSAEFAVDTTLDLEAWATRRLVPTLTRTLSPDLWTGTGAANGEPYGLLPAVSMVPMVSSVITVHDLGAALADLPAVYRFGGNCSIILSPGAYAELFDEDVDVTKPLRELHLLGHPVRVDPALEGVCPAVVGDFRSAYVIRLCPVQVRFSSDGPDLFGRDRMALRVVLRADGRPLLADAARALTSPVS